MAMTQPEFGVRHVDHISGIAIIDLQGDLNAAAADVLDAAYTQASAQDPSTILLNFSGVDYINSTGIALIIGLVKRANQLGRHMLAYGLSSHYAKIFRMTRLADFIGIYPNEPEALANSHDPGFVI